MVTGTCFAVAVASCIRTLSIGSFGRSLFKNVFKLFKMASVCQHISAGFSWRSRFEPSGNVLLGSLGQLVAAKVTLTFRKRNNISSVIIIIGPVYIILLSFYIHEEISTE